MFYDDEDKSYECILTDQLLQMRNSLVPKFPGTNLIIFLLRKSLILLCGWILLTHTDTHKHTHIHDTFEGLDIYKPGKKPPGFARLLLHEWKRHYPETQENNKTISKKIGKTFLST